VEGGSQAEHHSGHEGHTDSEKQNRRVDRDFVEARQTVRQDLPEKFFGAEEDGDSGDGTGEGEQQTFGKQLLDETAARGAESLTQGHFASTRTGAREQKIRNIDSAD
jgi:hypothetical protein